MKQKRIVKLCFMIFCFFVLLLIGTLKSIANPSVPVIKKHIEEVKFSKLGREIYDSAIDTRKILSVDITDAAATSLHGGGEDAECGDYHKVTNVSNHDICVWINTTDDCDIDEGFINYLKIVYCQMTNAVVAGIILFFLWWLFLFIGLATTADDFFCPALTVISKTLRLSHNIAIWFMVSLLALVRRIVIHQMLLQRGCRKGVTFLAFGNGAPDIFSAIAAIGNAKNGDAGLAVGALFGAGIFVTCIVVGAISVTKPFTAMQRPFLRDIIFYLAAVFWTFNVLYDRMIYTAEAVGFIGLYIGYVLVVIIGRFVYQYQKRKQEKNTKEEQLNQEEPSPSPSGTELTDDFMTVNTEDTIDSIGTAPYLKPHHVLHHHHGHNSVHAHENANYGSVHNVDDSSGSPPVDNSTGSQQSVIRGLNAGLNTPQPRPQKAVKDLAHAVENVTVSAALGHDVEENPVLRPQRSVTNGMNGNNELTEGDEEMKPLLEQKEKKEESMLSEFLWGICPVDIDEWAPVLFLLLVTIPIVDYEEEKHKWNKLLNTLHCISGPVVGVLLTNQAFKQIGGVFPVWALVLIIGCLLAVAVFCTSKHNKQPVYHPAFAYLGFLISVVWIYSIANEIVNILQMFGVIFNLSNGILGLTLLAWGNSIGDLIADTVMAKQGFPRMGVSACFGGPLFNLLLGIGIPFTLGCIKQGGVFHIQFTLLQVILTVFLMASLVSSLVVVPLRKFFIDRVYGIYLWVLYVVFLVLAILVETKVITYSGLPN